jgi:long-chain acyl-CoA synthetase
MTDKNTSLFKLFHKAGSDKGLESKCLSFYKDGNLNTFTYNELFKKVALLNKFLSIHGVKQGDRVGIVSENRLEWTISDLATISTGIINVPTFPNFTSDQQQYIFNDCDAKAVIVSSKLQLDKILSIRSELEHLKFIIVIDEGIEDLENSIYSFEKILKQYEKEYNTDNLIADLLSNAENVNLESTLTLIYTSGTTGNPKGVILTNRNLVSNVKSIQKAEVIDNSDSFLSFLPMCHAYERCVTYTFFLTGAVVTIAQSLDTLTSNINEVKPTIVTAVPKLLETISNKVNNAFKNEWDSKKKIIYKALDYSKRLLEKEKPSFAQSLKLRIYDRLIYSKVRSKLGGNIKYIISGGAALHPEVQKFFHSVGLNILQGYGLTECSPVVSVNRPNNLEIGTVGPPLDDVEVEIEDNGEILVRGDLVMKGYWHDDFATKSSIDDHGWYYTGDIGEFTNSGSLKITGRIKSIIVTSGGKNISPAPIEDLIRMSDFVEYIAIFGEGKDYLIGLVSPDGDALKSLSSSLGIEYDKMETIIQNKKVLSAIKKDIDIHQSSLSKFERVRKISLVSTPFSIDGGELTPKMSMKKNMIEKKYKHLIDELY